MTNYVVGNQIVGNAEYGIRFGGDGDSLYVTRNGSIIPPSNADAFFTAVNVITGNQNYVTVAGEAFGNFGIYFVTGNGSVNIISGGIVSAEITAITNNGGPLSVSNAGSIFSNNYAILGYRDLILTNSGIIQGSRYGAESLGNSNITNSGTIVGTTDDGIYAQGTINLTNSGTIEGSTGLFSIGGGTVVNSGLLEGTLLAGIVGSGLFGVTNTTTGIITGIGDGIRASAVIIDNHGTISGGGNGIITTGALTLDNSGTVTGVTGAAIATASAADSITNDGHISGNITLGGGNDTYDGGGGTVRGTIILGAGNDTGIGGAGSEVFSTGTLTAFDGDDSIDGGAGRDTLDLSGAGSAVRVNLNTGLVSGALVGVDTVDNFEFLIATDFNDRIVAGPSALNAQSRGGNDVLTGGAGADVLACGTGNDTASGLGGNDRINGGAGLDTIAGGQGADLVTGGADADLLTGGTEADTFLFRARSDFGTTTAFDRITDFVRGPT